jgi:hypothetical protein
MSKIEIGDNLAAVLQCLALVLGFVLVVKACTGN